ncbi:MAG: glutathione S-transferase N-terminal domain-containing protein [Gammaproteobacteria bacterium]
MTLYSNPASLHSHRARIVLAEKGIVIDVVSVQDENLPEDLLDLNPYHSTPTLLDRDLVLYDSRVIMEYIDERFPHPPLMPVDPVSRAHVRLALYRVEKDWYAMAEQCEKTTDRKQITQSRKVLQESLLSSAEVFAAKRYFLSDEFSIVDASVAPLLWRLPKYGIELNGSGVQPIRRYMDHIFARRAFQESLSEVEMEMRQ